MFCGEYSNEEVHSLLRIWLLKGYRHAKPNPDYLSNTMRVQIRLCMSVHCWVFTQKTLTSYKKCTKKVIIFAKLCPTLNTIGATKMYVILLYICAVHNWKSIDAHVMYRRRNLDISIIGLFKFCVVKKLGQV